MYLKDGKNTTGKAGSSINCIHVKRLLVQFDQELGQIGHRMRRRLLYARANPSSTHGARCMKAAIQQSGDITILASCAACLEDATDATQLPSPLADTSGAWWRVLHGVTSVCVSGVTTCHRHAACESSHTLQTCEPASANKKPGMTRVTNQRSQVDAL